MVSDDALHKPVPQAIDLEEAVLGAVMSETTALPQINFLRHEHFHIEAHSLIYGAVEALAAQKLPIDMRTVVIELRKTGHLEIVGGAHYVAELASRVSSAANIVYHARILIEQYIKRQIITLSSQLQQQGYDDTSDVFDLLDRAKSDLDALERNTIVQSDETKIKDAWNELIVKVQPPEEKILIRIGEATVSTPENHMLVTGAKKARKSLLITHLIGEFFAQNKGAGGDEVCIFDTEQGRWHVWRYFDRIFRLTGKKVTMFYLRGKGFKDRRDIIEHTIKFWPTKVRVIVIDGIRDLVSNINDPDETTELIEWLEGLILRHQVHVINVLHLNKTDGNARGHLGSELQNKAQTSIKVELDEEAGVSQVSCESSRDKGFDAFAFTHSTDGLPQLADMPTKEAISPDDRRNRLVICFADGPLGYKALHQSIRDNFAVANNKARHMIQEFVRLGWIAKFGKDRAPDTVYKMLISENGHAPEEKVVTSTPLRSFDQPMKDDAEPLPF